MDLKTADWVNISLTEALLAREGPPLFVAAQLGCIAAARVMAEAGSHLEVLGPRRQRPLHVAAAGGHTGIIAALVNAGCEIDPRDEDGNTPLVAAILHGQTGAVELLLAVGADVAIPRLDGLSAIDIAELPGTPPNIRALIALGRDAAIDPFPTNFQRKETPMFKGILINKDDNGYTANYQAIDDSVLQDGDVTVKVEWSTLNYKDGLAITGKSPVVRRFPMVPGIDFAGTVTASGNPQWKVGDKVVLNGWGVGETHCGGLAEVARVKGEWLVPLPANFSARQAMAIGTAGYTAMLCVLALEKHGIKPADGEILVTGANGGVGSVAIVLLAKLGYTVVASTGRVAESDHLKALGAASVIDRAELAAPGKPLGKERWAGVVDAVGSHTLANACATTKYRGAVAACGLAGGMDFPSTVMPFILRGVTLYGIDSVMAPLAVRQEAWQRLSRDLDPARLDAMTGEVALSAAIPQAAALLAGQVRGRLVVDVSR